MPLTDYLAARPCPTCKGDGEDIFIDGELLRAKRIARWGKNSGRRMAREIRVSAMYLCDLEKNRRNWTEDLARAYLCALGVL